MVGKAYLKDKIEVSGKNLWRKKRDEKGWKEYKHTNCNENGKLVALEGTKSVWGDNWGKVFIQIYGKV